MSNRLSFSQTNKYQQCPTAFKFWYLDKIRPTKMRSALLFGTAIDKAIGVLLNPEEDKNRTPEQVFEFYWEHQEVNGERTYLPDNISLVYAKADFDKDLLTSADINKLGISKDAVLELIEKRTDVGYDSLSQDEKTLSNHAFWLCLKNKGIYMIKAFRNKILPLLTKIHSTQEFIELDNGEDKLIGYIDIVANVEGYDEPIVLDVKTSAILYEKDSVILSPQLSLYVHAVSDKYKTKKAGFIVLSKNIIKNKTKTCIKCSFDGTGGKHKTCSNEINGKRCNGEWSETFSPEANVQFIIDEIPQQTEDLVLDNIDDINLAIKTNHFTRNLQSCNSNFGPCDYIGYCYRGSMHGLVQKG